MKPEIEQELLWHYKMDKPARFLTMEDADAFLNGDFSKAIFQEDPRYQDAPYEYGFITSRPLFKRLIPAKTKQT